MSAKRKHNNSEHFRRPAPWWISCEVPPTERIAATVVNYRRGYRRFIRLMVGRRVVDEMPILDPNETDQQAHDRYLLKLGMESDFFEITGMAGDDETVLAMPGEILPCVEPDSENGVNVGANA